MQCCYGGDDSDDDKDAGSDDGLAAAGDGGDGDRFLVPLHQLVVGARYYKHET